MENNCPHLLEPPKVKCFRSESTAFPPPLSLDPLEDQKTNQTSRKHLPPSFTDEVSETWNRVQREFWPHREADGREFEDPRTPTFICNPVKYLLKHLWGRNGECHVRGYATDLSTTSTTGRSPLQNNAKRQIPEIGIYSCMNLRMLTDAQD